MIKIIYANSDTSNYQTINKIVEDKASKNISIQLLNHADIKILMEEDLENNIIISRGVSFLTLKTKIKHAHMVEQAMIGYDIMRGLDECKKIYNAKNIAVIISKCIPIEKEFIESTFNIKLSIFPAENHDHMAQLYNKVKGEKFDAILSGNTVFRMGVRDNLNCVPIKSGYEATLTAINEAYSVANAIIEERKRNEIFKIILENSSEGFLAVDNAGIISTHNANVYRILNIPPCTDLKGKNISFVLPIISKDDNILSEFQEANTIKNINNKMVILNTTPIMLEDKILGTVLTVQNVDKLQKTEIDIRKKLSNKGLFAKYNFHNIIGHSEAITKTITIAKKYAAANSNVLIIGETGTGKELFAQSIHNMSKRGDQPFVAINCAALPENLLESELFGYVEGAFTGAVKGGKVGLFEMSHKGTLFLDEIAELPLGLQAKLLRVLQEKEIRKLGDDRIIPVDVRIIAASNVDLQKKVDNNSFRQDLLYRVDILNLSVPPLRERKSDLKELAMHFLSTFMDDSQIRINLTDEAIIELIKYNWPGNIRELRNICERLVVLSTNNQITGEDVKEVFRIKNLNQTNDTNTINNNDNNVTMKVKGPTRKEMARMLGVSRTTLWRKTRKSNIL